ncbi:MAG: type II toxin-antitoxin system RelE/ParE family toxin [Clostridiales bacterium]|nr:type II toxin-antitoxin system RelE/ParE family toxin [Clostridiales bacterium]
MYQIKILESVEKELSKMDKQTVRIIKNWIVKNLVDTDDPRNKGKALKGIWRYRIGDYRLFATIEDDIMTVFLFEISHRRDVYK